MGCVRTWCGVSDCLLGLVVLDEGQLLRVLVPVEALVLLSVVLLTRGEVVIFRPVARVFLRHAVQGSVGIKLSVPGLYYLVLGKVDVRKKRVFVELSRFVLN